MLLYSKRHIRESLEKRGRKKRKFYSFNLTETAVANGLIGNSTVFSSLLLVLHHCILGCSGADKQQLGDSGRGSCRVVALT